MRFLSWNCQGLGFSLTVQSLKELNRKFKMSIIFLMETTDGRKKLDRIRNRLRMPPSTYVNLEGMGEGLALWWNNEVDVSVGLNTKNIIDTKVSFLNENVTCRITWVYASCDFNERMDNWNKLRRFKLSNDLAWLCVGDFNDILEHSEKGGGRVKNPRNISCFQKLIRR